MVSLDSINTNYKNITADQKTAFQALAAKKDSGTDLTLDDINNPDNPLDPITDKTTIINALTYYEQYPPVADSEDDKIWKALAAKVLTFSNAKEILAAVKNPKSTDAWTAMSLNKLGVSEAQFKIDFDEINNPDSPTYKNKTAEQKLQAKIDLLVGRLGWTEQCAKYVLSTEWLGPDANISKLYDFAYNQIIRFNTTKMDKVYGYKLDFTQYHGYTKVEVPPSATDQQQIFDKIQEGIKAESTKDPQLLAKHPELQISKDNLAELMIAYAKYKATGTTPDSTTWKGMFETVAGSQPGPDGIPVLSKLNVATFKTQLGVVQNNQNPDNNTNNIGADKQLADKFLADMKTIDAENTKIQALTSETDKVEQGKQLEQHYQAMVAKYTLQDLITIKKYFVAKNYETKFINNINQAIPTKIFQDAGEVLVIDANDQPSIKDPAPTGAQLVSWFKKLQDYDYSQDNVKQQVAQLLQIYIGAVQSGKITEAYAKTAASDFYNAFDKVKDYKFTVQTPDLNKFAQIKEALTAQKDQIKADGFDISAIKDDDTLKKFLPALMQYIPDNLKTTTQVTFTDLLAKYNLKVVNTGIGIEEITPSNTPNHIPATWISLASRTGKVTITDGRILEVNDTAYSTFYSDVSNPAHLKVKPGITSATAYIDPADTRKAIYAGNFKDGGVTYKGYYIPVKFADGSLGWAVEYNQKEVVQAQTQSSVQNRVNTTTTLTAANIKTGKIISNIGDMAVYQFNGKYYAVKGDKYVELASNSLYKYSNVYFKNGATVGVLSLKPAERTAAKALTFPS